MTKPDWVTKLESEPCHCVKCSACDGTGTIYYDIGGKYIGPHRIDDLADPESCDQCSGGIAEPCDRCELLEQWEMEP